MDWDGANVTYVNTNPDAPPMLPPRDSDVEKEAAKRSFRSVAALYGIQYRHVANIYTFQYAGGAVSS